MTKAPAVPVNFGRGGVFIVLRQDGHARIERGYVRPQDAPVVEPEPDTARVEGKPAEPETKADGGAEEEDDGLAPLSDRLVADVTAHRTAALRDALAYDPDAALLVLIHAAVLRTFYGDAGTPAPTSASCRRRSPAKPRGSTTASRRGAAHRRAARSLGPSTAPGGVRRLGVRAGPRRRQPHGDPRPLRGPDAQRRARLERRPAAWAHADALAGRVGLDITGYWTPGAQSYFGRVTKARIGEAVREAVSQDAAERLGGLKKGEMAQAAEHLVARSGWLPPLLRTLAADPADDAVAIAAE